MRFTPSELGEEIRRVREAQGVSRNDLAARAGVGKTALFDLEHGNPGVRLNTLLAILHELEMDLNLDSPRPAPPSPGVPDPEPSVGSPDLPDHLL